MRLVHVGARFAGLALLLLAGACSVFDDSSAQPVQTAPAQTPAASAEPASLQPSTPLDDGTKPPTSHPVQVFEGTDSFVKIHHVAVRGSAQGDITLDFADADIRDVVRSVLGDMLHLPYVIDPQIAGHVTLKTGAPIAKSDVLPAFEAALKLGGAAVVLSNSIYNVVPLSDAQKRASLIAHGAHNNEPGYGIEIIPLQFISANDMQKILGPLVPPGSIVSTDEGRNLIFLAGTYPDRASIRDTIALFDVDYLKSMSFEIIQPQHIDAETLANELDKVFEGVGSPISGVVKLIPVVRINSLLVVTSRAAYLREVSQWVNRLDVPPVEPGRRLYYYRLQNARASDIAQTLSQLFGGVVAAPAAPSSPQAPPAMPSLGGGGFGGAGGGGLPAMWQNMPASAPAPAPAPTPQAAPAGVPGMPASGPKAADANGPQIVTDIANNALIIRADQVDYASIERIIREMDVAPDQVLIEATIAEVTLNDTLQYGVEWYFQNKSQQYNFSQTGIVAPSFPGFAFSYLVPNVQVAISALGNVSHVTVLSSPKILTLDNRAASLEVGDQVPMVSQTATSVNGAGSPLVSTVQMQNTGVILSVTPRVSKSGMVTLDVSQEVSDAIPTTTSSIDSPTIEDRNLQATVAIKDGQTVALGGLIQESDTKSNGGIPFLQDIPYLGYLAKNINNTKERTELLVFLTPRVIKNPDEAQSMTDDLAHGLSDVKAAMDQMKKDGIQPHSH
jgi:general secretion pathway protein D